MAGYTNGEREKIISWCKALDADSLFDVTSDPVPFYNCIGFAMGMTDVCVALAHPTDLYWQWWPPTAHRDLNPKSLIEAFEYFGFENCGMDSTLESEYDKVALYSKDNEWTHAAWIDECNVYHSKLGVNWDITHGAENVFHETCYGDIFTYMRRKKSDSHITQDKKPQTGVMHYAGMTFAIMNHDGNNFGYVRVG